MDGSQGVELTEEQQRRLAMLGELRRGEAAWQRDRLIVIGTAAEMVDNGQIALEEACAALEISARTWARRRAELRAHLAGRGSAGASAEGDQAAAGAREVLGYE